VCDRPLVHVKMVIR